MQDQAKHNAAITAAAMAEDGWVVGLGTGTTAALAIEELGRRLSQEGLRILGVPTSYAAETLARRYSIPLCSMEDTERIHLAIDGADEVDPGKNLIKGAGGAHTREKIVAYFADQFVVVVDETKMVQRLGSLAPVPVEVLPVAVATVIRELQALGSSPLVRRMGSGPGHDDPFITEQGNLVVDVRFPSIEDPRGLEQTLNNIPGVVENGLFAGRAHLILIGQLESEEVRRMR